MKYKQTVEGRFIDRPNRFIAHVEVNGVIETVHVKNTGRCKELLIPDSRVILEVSDNPNRKTKYDLVVVYKEGLGWVNIDSQVPNTVVKEWLNSGKSCFDGITFLKPEYTYGKSRVDFYLECGDRKIFIEVKGCTLEIDGEGYFPDAPTERGLKHVKELTRLAQSGETCYIILVVQMENVDYFIPDYPIHYEFGKALEKAAEAGVRVLAFDCRVKEDSMDLGKPVEVRFL